MSGAKIELLRIEAAACPTTFSLGIPRQLVKEIAKEPDWRKAYKKRQCPSHENNQSFLRGSEKDGKDRVGGEQVNLQTVGEDDETQAPALELETVIPETPLSEMPPPIERFESEAGISTTKPLPSSSQRKRGPAFNLDEQARLAHVMADPRMSFTLTKMCNKPESRAEIDDQRENPWDGIISDMFNDDSMDYVRPKPAGGALMTYLDDFDPNYHPFVRSGTVLKAKWAKLRSIFTVVYSRWSASGQNDPDDFPRFVSDGNGILS